MRARDQIERNDAGRVIGRTGAKDGAVAIDPDRAELRERCLQWPQHPVFQIEHCKLADPSLGIGADDPIRSGTGVCCCTKSPQRYAELSRHWCKRFRCPRGKVEAVEIPPTAAIGHEEDCPTVGRPFGLED